MTPSATEELLSVYRATETDLLEQAYELRDLRLRKESEEAKINRKKKLQSVQDQLASIQKTIRDIIQRHNVSIEKQAESGNKKHRAASSPIQGGQVISKPVLSPSSLIETIGLTAEIADVFSFLEINTVQQAVQYDLTAIAHAFASQLDIEGEVLALAVKDNMECIYDIAGVPPPDLGEIFPVKKAS